MWVTQLLDSVLLALQMGVGPPKNSAIIGEILFAGEMEAGGVVVRTVEGRRTVITLDLSNLITIANTLMHLCCAGESSNINLTKRSR